MKTNHLKFIFFLITLGSYSCKKIENSLLRIDKSQIPISKNASIIFATKDDSILFFTYLKIYDFENKSVLKNKTFKADKNGTFQIPYSSDKFPIINSNNEFKGFQSSYNNTNIGFSVLRNRPDLIAVNPPLSQEPIPPGGGGGISAYVRNNGLYLGKTDMGTKFYPYMAFYACQDSITHKWTTYWAQTGSGIGGFEYENVWTQNSNGYTSSFGHVTWSMSGNVGVGHGGISLGGFPISESHTYSVYIQIDSYGNRTVKITRENN